MSQGNNNKWQLFLLITYLICAGIWIYFNHSEESIISVIVILIMMMIIYFKQRPITTESEEDPYKASYEVEGFHDDFSKVGSGYPMKKNQKIPCCGGSIVEGDTCITKHCCGKKEERE